MIGDYAKGIDSGKIQIYIDAKLTDKKYLKSIIMKTEKKINRRIYLLEKIDPFDEKLILYEKK